MKPIKLLAAATALVMAATPAFAANWILTTGSRANNTVFYYDADTIQRSGNQVTVWEKEDVLGEYGLMDYSIGRSIYDCAERTYTLLNSTNYFRDGTNKSYNYASTTYARPITPGSVAEFFLKAVCR